MEEDDVTLETGFISTYNERSASGFIRPVIGPRRLVKFHQSTLERDAEYVLQVGQEVKFARTDPATHALGERWDEAKCVEISWADGSEVEGDRLD